MFAVLAKCAVASAFGKTKLGMAIDAENFKTIDVLCRNNEYNYHKGLEYAIETKPPGFVIGLIKRVNRDFGSTVAILYRKGNEKTVDEVLKGVNFSQSDLVTAAGKLELMCSPHSLPGLLNGIESPEGQESAIAEGIRWLFVENRVDCIIPLLAVLSDGTVQNKQLRDVAIREVFKKSVEYRKEIWVQGLFDHRAVDAEVYAYGLSVLWPLKTSSPVFTWLLERADKGDLQAVQGMKGYSDKHQAFRDAIEKAIPMAKAGGSRHEGPIKAAGITMEIVQGIIGSDEGHSRIHDTIVAYITDGVVVDAEEYDFCGTSFQSPEGDYCVV